MRIARSAAERLNALAAPTVPLPPPFSRMSRGMGLRKGSDKRRVCVRRVGPPESGDLEPFHWSSLTV
jgi:hypothetical protein